MLFGDKVPDLTLWDNILSFKKYFVNRSLF